MTLSAFMSPAKHPKAKEMQPAAKRNEEKKTAFVPPTTRSSKRLCRKRSVETKETIKDSPPAPSKSTMIEQKTVFECPKCLKQFPLYFSVVKHIKKLHCEDKDGNPVHPDSEQLIKPVSIEINTGNGKIKEPKGNYSCLACKQTFGDVEKLDIHIENKHTKDMDEFILPNMIEFFSWKNNVEAIQKVKYLSLFKSKQKNYYQCNYVSPKNTATMTHLCPSLMITQVTTKGVQICYHKEHYEHVSKKVDIPKSNYASDESDRSIKKGIDLFSKFKDMMNNVVQRASFLHKNQLKQLFISVQEMESYLDNLQKNDKTSLSSADIKTEADSLPSDDDNRDDHLDESSCNSMTDDQITKALEKPRESARLKGKTESSPGPENQAPRKKTTLKKTSINSVGAVGSPRPNIASPSFNDSYRQFIESSSPKVEADGPPTKKVKKEIVKTKIGQFSPRKTVRIQVDQDAHDSKIVEEKCNTSLENISLKEVEYEVVEQENDCNILILKI